MVNNRRLAVVDMVVRLDNRRLVVVDMDSLRGSRFLEAMVSRGYTRATTAASRS